MTPSRKLISPPDDELYKEMEAFISSQSERSNFIQGEITTISVPNFIVKRWMCYRGSENAIPSPPRKFASEYVGAFGENIDGFDIKLVLRNEGSLPEFVFATEDGSIGFSPQLAETSFLSTT